MRHDTRLGWIPLCCLCWTAAWAVACSESARSEDGTDVAAAPPEPASAFIVEGTPGPWWRNGASRADFDVDLSTCRGRSSEARRIAAEDPPDAAYRAFLECMDELAWTRGASPRRAGPDPI